MTFGSLTTREALKILGMMINYFSIWAGFVAIEIAAWLKQGQCHLYHYSDGTFYIDCPCYQPGYQGKC